MGRLLRYRRHTLLLLFVLSGVSVGAVFVVLISREVHKELRQRQAVEEVRQRGGVAHRGSRMNSNSSSGVVRRVTRYLGGSGLMPAWYADSGDVESVMWDPHSVEDLDQLHAFPGLSKLRLRGAKVTDAALGKLVGLGQISELWLVDTLVTDEGLALLAQLPSLRSLKLHSCKLVTAETLTQLSGLRSLALNDCPLVTIDLIITLQEANPELGVELSPGVHLPAFKAVRNLEILSFTGPLAIDALLAATRKHAQSVTRIGFDKCGVTNDGLKSLRSHPQLTAIDLFGNCPTKKARADSRFTYVAGASHITDDGLEYFGVLSNLTHLTVMNCQVTDHSMKSIGRLEKLNFLELSGDSITNSGLQYLRQLEGLTSLYLHDTAITDDGLRELQVFRNLSVLSLAGTMVTDQGLTEVATFASLEFLDLSGTRINDKGISQLTKMESLRHLKLDDTPITDQSIEDLCLLPLTRLTVFRTQITENGMERLKQKFGEAALK